MPSNLVLATSYASFITTPSGTTATYQGGSGVPQAPYEWRLLSGLPFFAQPMVMSFKRVVKNIDQMVVKLNVPYTVTNSTTSQEEAVAYAETTLTVNLPRNVPDATSEKIVAMAATILGNKDFANANLFTSIANRQAG